MKILLSYFHLSERIKIIKENLTTKRNSVGPLSVLPALSDLGPVQSVPWGGTTVLNPIPDRMGLRGRGCWE